MSTESDDAPKRAKRQPTVLEFAREFTEASAAPANAGRGGILGSLKGIFGGR